MGEQGGTPAPSAVVRLLGQWRLAATTVGFFDWPRVDSAEFSYSEESETAVRLDVRFVRAGRTHEIAGTVDTRPGKAGLFRWRGRGARFIVARGWWGVAVTADGQFALLRYPGTWLTDEGSLLLARPDVDRRTMEALAASRAGELGLTPVAVRTLSWRA